MSKTFSSLVVAIRAIELHSGSADPSAGGGVVAPIGSCYFRTDGTIWVKTGAGNTAWVNIATTSTGNIGFSQRFTYTVTGAEGDLTALTIALPAARANNTYQVGYTIPESVPPTAII